MEVKDRLSDPNFDHSPILQVAFDAGFNSKAAFNRAFKKQTGMTPSQFKRTDPR
jgi:AraC-like DNA-binding protein